MASRHRRYFLQCVALLAGAAASAVAQEQSAPAPAPPSSGMDLGTAASYIVGLIFVGAVIWIFLAVKRGVDDQRRREEIADAQFEIEALATLRNLELSPELQPIYPGASAPAPAEAENTDGLAAEVPVQEAAPASAPAPALVKAPAAPAVSPLLAQSDEPERADVTAAAALSQLRGAGLIADIEGYVELHGNRHGAVTVRFRDGRRALIVPYHETEQFIRRNLRRYDLLIFVGRDGKAAVVSSLETMIADRVSSRF